MAAVGTEAATESESDSETEADDSFRIRVRGQRQVRGSEHLIVLASMHGHRQVIREKDE